MIHSAATMATPGHNRSRGSVAGDACAGDSVAVGDRFDFGDSMLMPILLFARVRAH